MVLADLFSFSDDKQCAYLTIAKLENPITQRDIVHALAENHLGSALVHADIFPMLVSEINRETRTLDEIKEPKIILIAERRDAFFEIRTAKDNLSASLIFTQAYDGKGVTPEQVMQAIDDKKIEYGINNEAIHTFLQDTILLESGKMDSVVIAQGVPCENGRDAYFEYFIDPNISRRYVPEVDKKTGKINILRSYHMLTVNEGEPLMRLHPATQGRVGINIFAQEIKPIQGKVLSFKNYEGSRLNAEDENLLEASMSGQPKFYSDGAGVVNILEVDNVDMHSGNIDFDGSIIVRGDIKPKMKVKVSGDLEVRGVIEDACIEVTGELFAVKGIIGKKNPEMESLSCVIKVDGDIESDFAQYARIECTQDIRIQNYVSHCEVITQGRLIVTNDRHTTGSIIGGVLCADKGIEATYLGTQAEIETHCEIFFHYIKLCKRIAEEEQRRDVYRTTLYKLDLIKKKLEAIKDSDDQGKREEKLLTVTHNQRSYENLLVESTLRLEALQAKLVEDEKKVSVTIHKCAYPGCKLTVGVHRLAITKEKSPMRYRLQHGKLRKYRLQA